MKKALLWMAFTCVGSLSSARAADSVEDAYAKAVAAFGAGHSQEAYELLKPFWPDHRGDFKFDLLFGESACQTASADMWGAQYLEEMSRSYETELNNNEDEHRQLMKADIACISQLRPDDHTIFERHS